MNVKSKLWMFFIKNILNPNKRFKPVAGVIVFRNPDGEYESICYDVMNDDVFTIPDAPELFKKGKNNE